MKKPNVPEKEIDKLDNQFKQFESQIQELTLDRMNEAPKEEVELQVKLSQKEIANSKDIYLKPKSTISSREKFNERFRSDYNYAKENVYFTAENREIIGENIEMWTKPFPGVPAEYWSVPTNKPVWGPRYLAEQIRGCVYHRMIMDEKKVTGEGSEGAYYGSMIVDKTVPRLYAEPATKSKSVFISSSF